ncbi:peptide ABC transporter permease [Actinobaculum suis]|nr:peptide ABC transporter permease [Actinobaculum suis]OCA96269.1 peptide ABC transporter permease [Actinobaculum suis]
MAVAKPQRPGPYRRAVVTCIASAVVIVALLITGFANADQALVTDFTNKALAPYAAEPFGTDWMGRSLLARTVTGLALSILIGLFAATVSAIIALILGTLAALGPKWVDNLVSWLINLMLGLPHMLLLILISVAIGRGFWGVAIGVAVTHWPSLARVIRSEVMQVRDATYVAIDRKLGCSPFRIAVKHMLPAVIPQFLVGLVLLFPHAILHEASITFLGFGLSPEQPAIGVILSESMSYLTAGMWWSALFPGLSLLLMVLVFQLFGRSLRVIVEDRRRDI